MEENAVKCVDCPYHWREEGEEYPVCHYGWNDGYAPCEVDDNYDDEE